jgi:hypothetical protein
MANYWTAPKTNWVANDGIGYEDLNRIEANVSAVRDATKRRVQGFGYVIANNPVASVDGVVTILPGSAYSSDGFPIRRDTNIVKNLTTWVQGSGNDKGGMASAVTVAGYTWYYAFALLDPTNGNVEVMFDDNPAGTNVSSGIYTKKRYINCFKTGAAGDDGSFLLCEQYSTGDRVYINPASSYPANHRGIHIGKINNNYGLHTLYESPPNYFYATPARDVRADINIVGDHDIWAIGIISSYGAYYSAGAPDSGEVSLYGSIMIPAARTLNIAVMTISDGDIIVAGPGFYDDRLQ